MSRLFIWALLALVPTAAYASSSEGRGDHKFGLSASLGVPHLIAGELRLHMVPRFEFGAGFGAFPINVLANSLYKFTPVPLDMGTTDTYNLYPSGTFSMSGIYAFARWFPTGSGFFVHLAFHSISFSASLDGTLRNETLGTSAGGAISGGVSISQSLIDFGPGYQFLIGDHFHLDLGAGVIFLLPATARTDVGGSLSSFTALNASASANYEAAKANLSNAVENAMSQYRNSVKFLPSVYFSFGYMF